MVPSLRAGAAPGSADDTRDMLLRSFTLRLWSVKAPAPDPQPIDTTLIPPGTQYGATLGKAKQRNPLRYAGFASLCNSLQHLTDHS
jgi:hypothetical protein